MTMEEYPRKIFKRNFGRIFVLFGLFFVAVFGLWAWQNSARAAFAPSIITYQGKLLVNGSSASSTLSMKFVLFDSLTGGTALYTASGTLPTTSTLSVTPTSGLFSVDLGGTGTNSLDPTIFQNNQSVYLEVTVGSQILTPRKQITAAPYAFNARYLDGLATSSIAKVATNETISGAWSFSATTSITGRLGVGTTTPDQKLTVVGSISNPVSNLSGVTKIASLSGSSLFYYGLFVSGRYAYLGSTSRFEIVDISRPSVPVLVTSSASIGATRGLFVSGRYAYVTDGNTKFYVIDVSNPIAPVRISTTSVGAGAYFVAVSGRYAYVANNTANSISVIDISDPLAPTQIATTSVGAGPYSVAVSGRYAYTANGGAGTISVIDISNPSASVQVATTSLGSGADPRSIVVSGRYAYTANYGASTISVINITNASSPTVVATSSLPLDSNGQPSSNPSSIFVSGRYIYTVNPSSQNMSIFDISNPSSPVPLVSTVADVGNFGSTAVSIFVSGRYAYIGGGDSGGFFVVDLSGAEFSTLMAHSAEVGQIQSRNDIIAQGVVQAGTSLHVGAGGIISNGAIAITATNTASYFGGGITNIGTVTTTNLTVIGTSTLTILSVTSTATFSNTISVTGTSTLATTTATGLTISQNGLIITSSTPAVTTNALYNLGGNLYWNGSVVSSSGNLPTGADGQTLFSAGTTWTATSAIYISSSTGRVGIGTTTPDKRLSVVGSISNPVNGNSGISQIATTSLGTGSPAPIAVSGRYAYVANYGADTISVVDISNPSLPVQIATTSVGDAPHSIAVSGRYAYVANLYGDTISVVDISNPSLPVQIATTSVGDGPYSIAVSGRYAYTANNNADTISVVDISNPSAPTQIATTAVGDGSRSIFVSGRYAYVANYNADTISVVDISSSSAPIQIATTSVGDGPYSIAVSGRYAYVTNFNANTISVVDLSGAEFSTLMAHSAEVGQIQSRNDIIAQGIIQAGTSLQVGAGGIISNGSIAVTATNTASYFGGGITVSGMTTSTSLTITGNSTLSGTLSVTGTSTLTTTTITRLGIGSSTPTTALTVIGTSTLRDIVPEMTGASANMSVYSIGASTTRWSNIWAQYINVGTSTYSLTASNSTFSITDQASGAGNNRFYINSSGLVGINTSSPTSQLSVQGDSLLNGTVTSTALVVTGNSTLATLTATGAGTFSSTIGVTGTSTLATTTVSGRLGINTTTPDQRLTVVGSVSNPVNANSGVVQIVTTSVGDAPQSIFVSGRYAYVANFNADTISVVDISRPSAPTQIATTSVGNAPYSIYVSGRYAYTANNIDNTISVVDISNPTAPMQIATTSVGVDPLSIFVSGRYAYTANASANTISVVDISNPSSPTQIATTSVGGTPYSIFVSGRYAYTANGEGIVSVVDISNPSSPTQIATTSVGGNAPYSIYVSGRYAYTANNESNTISVVDISNPSSPTQIATTSVGSSPISIFVSGRYAYVANTGIDTISVVDISNPSAPTQIATTSVGDGPKSVTISGRYAYVANFNADTISIVDLSGAEFSTLMAHSAEVGQIQSRNDIIAQGIVQAGTSLQVGIGGVLSNGPVVSTNGTSTFINLSFATSTTFSNSVGSFTSSTAFILNAANFSTASTTSYILSLRSNGQAVFSVSANGDMRASGALYAVSATVGTPGAPGDLAERVDIAPDDIAEAGDVVVVDPEGIDTYRRSREAYSQSVAGVISTAPTIVVGNGKTSHTAVMAMVGRVPVKVSGENGPIKRGDLLVSAALPGYAMRYNSEDDNGLKMVGIVGVALDNFANAGGTGKVMALIRTGWVNSRGQTVNNIKSDLEQLAQSQGVDINSDSSNLTVESNGGSLVYSSGNLNLHGGALLGVLAISGVNGRWAIDNYGRFVTRIDTANGQKDLYSVQSPSAEFVFSSSSQLVAGEVFITFDSSTQEIIDFTASLKVNITLTSGEAKGIYVSEKNTAGFIVKELGGGASNATFDWMVVTKRKMENSASAPVAEPTTVTESVPASEQTGSEQIILDSSLGTVTTETQTIVDSASSTSESAPVESATTSTASTEQTTTSEPATGPVASESVPAEPAPTEPAPVATEPIAEPTPAEPVPAESPAPEPTP